MVPNPAGHHSAGIARHILRAAQAVEGKENRLRMPVHVTPVCVNGPGALQSDHGDVAPGGMPVATDMIPMELLLRIISVPGGRELILWQLKIFPECRRNFRPQMIRSQDPQRPFGMTYGCADKPRKKTGNLHFRKIMRRYAVAP